MQLRRHILIRLPIPYRLSDFANETTAFSQLVVSRLLIAEMRRTRSRLREAWSQTAPSGTPKKKKGFIQLRRIPISRVESVGCHCATVKMNEAARLKSERIIIACVEFRGIQRNQELKKIIAANLTAKHRVSISSYNLIT